ncbi:MAG: hypothetical protein Q8N99_04480 [Nanoarchaeota archaeon]|nr:hypothetical protein [Nanoarchaeota archaeon]
MKKIITKEIRDSISKRNRLVIGIILIVIMILSTAGFALNYESGNDQEYSKITYNGITFLRNGDYWNFNSNGQDLMTKHNPEETKDVIISSRTYLDSYQNKPLYFVTETGMPDYEIGRNLNNFVLRIQNACIKGENCSTSLPIKDCKNDNIIIIKEVKDNEREKIYQEDKCVYIISSFSNQTKYTDAFVFRVLGI